MIDYSDKIQRGTDGCCPLCDCDIREYERSEVVTAHGSQYLCHADCLDEDEDDDGTG
jgi:hypothetical protein